jgi:hypothetical protein
MSIFSELIGGGASGVGDLVKKVVGTFKLDPEVKAQLEAEVERNKFELAKIDADLESKLADIQGQNIRADAQSGDKFTSRARPAFLWMMTFAVGMAIIVFPLINLFRGGPPLVLEIPDAYLSLFGVGFLGYTGARSWEKVSGKGGK